MSSGDTTDSRFRTRLPDLPFPDRSDGEALFATPARNRRPTRLARSIQASGGQPDRRMNISASSADYGQRDMVQSVSFRPPSPLIREPSSVAWSWSPPIMPHPLQMLGQAVPNLVMAVSAAVVAVFGAITPLGLPVWAAGIYIPTVILAIMSNAAVHPLWRRVSLLNLGTMAVIFPALVVRQSVIRLPFVDRDNGTLLAPTIATLVVVLCLVMLATACAVLSQEDPEYSGVAFLPAAMLVPMLAGQSATTSLTDSLWIVSVIYLVSALLTVLASMLPGAYPSLVAPLAIAIEFVALTLFRSETIFPLGAGSAAKTLFFLVVIVTVALSILVPVLSGWVRHVARIARGSTIATAPR